ncbi:MAG TPA: TM0106 family RecB-like putative nuclease [Acidimicrobiales bacterium]|nr:TM0106 family RecB-like putative nuclease [Acidimicrobiales bacterium]
MSEAADERIRAGNTFEIFVGERLVRLGVDVAVVPIGRRREDDLDGWASDRKIRLEATLAAMESGARTIWNPRLPADPGAHRSGEPDVLLRASGETRSAYFPIDVKAHFALAPEVRALGGSLTDLVSIDGPALPLLPSTNSSHREDLLQLAHYWRMLESIGSAPSGGPRGAIIGWSGRVDGDPIVGWFDLTATMELYESAFETAVAVVGRAVQIAAGADLDPLGAPWYKAACHECGWRGVCGPELLEVGHVSLVRPDRRIREELEELGVVTIDDLAVVELTRTRPDGRTVGESAPWREAIARARMARAGDPPPFSLLPEVGGDLWRRPRLWRKPDAPEQWHLTRRDVELDVDMESTVGGVYLWGVLLSYGPGDDPLVGFPAGYRGFGDRFPPPGDATTASVFVEFLEFIEALRDASERAGRSFGAYCYAGRSAEEPAMRRCAAATLALGGPDLSQRIETLVASTDWIDLLDELRDRVVGLNGLGLKNVARATGFEWRSADAGGEASMRWYESACHDTDPDVRAASRRKILEYNEDDVEATRHVRKWFSAQTATEIDPVP